MIAAPTARSSSWEKFVPVVLALIILCQVIFTLRFMGAVAGAADSSGYMNAARLLARGEFFLRPQPVAGVDAATLPGYVDNLYAPLGFQPMRGDGTISPVYPMGLPLLIVAAASVTTWEIAPGLVMILHAVAAVLLVFALAREAGLSPGWSALGALLLAVSPLVYHMSLWTMSDVPALVWTTAAILLAMRARRRPVEALAAGCALGLAVLVRPTNALALLPAIVVLSGRARTLLSFIGGGLPAAAAFALYNLKAYGSVFTTGYSNPVPDAFAFHHAGPTLVHYATWLPVLLTPLVLAAPLLPWARTVETRAKGMLGLWVLAFFGCYAIYSYTREDWWFLRFVLPAFPPLIVAALLALRDFSQRKPWRVSPVVAWVAVAAVVTLNGLLWTRGLYTRGSGKTEVAYQTTAAWVTDHLPPQAVVLAMQNSGALFYYTDFRLLRSDWFQPVQFRHVVPAIRAAGRPIYAVLQDFEQDDAFGRHIPGHWVKVERVLNSTVWRLEP